MLSLGMICLLAACTALAALLTISRVRGFGFVLRHASIVDIVFTIALVFMFAGTITGMLVAVMAGLFLSLILTGCRWIAKQGNPLVRKVDTDSEFTADGQWIYNTKPYV